MESTSQSTSHSVIETIVARQAELGITDEQLAAALGQQTAASVAFFKQGHLKLPIRQVSSIAATLLLDPVSLFRQVLSEYLPDVRETMKALSIPLNLTEDEQDVLATYRDLCDRNRGRLAVINGKAVVALVLG